MILDKFRRPLRDLRISVTDQCNMRCRYCMPSEIFHSKYQFLKESDKLTFNEIVRITRACESLGVKKIRLTGGEPLLRPNLAKLVKKISDQTTIEDIALTTNALLLAKKSKSLKEAGLTRINISLDALDSSIFKRMSGGYGNLNQVLNGIEESLKLGFKLKINSVIKRNVNVNQIIPLLEYGLNKNIEVRFIEYMDVGCSNKWSKNDVVPETEILSNISHSFGTITECENEQTAVSRSFQINKYNYQFGVIASISRPFCGGCIRARISSDGKLYTCLFSQLGSDLKTPIRNGISDEELVKLLTNNWKRRKDRYSEERGKISKEMNPIEMSYIGG